MTDANIHNDENGGATPPPRAKRQRPCAECGEPFTPAKSHSRYCSARCRVDFVNRRNGRGAILYDLFMALRFERELAAKLKVWSTMCRLAGIWRDEDYVRREGRKSWGDWKGWMLSRLDISSAVRLQNTKIGRKR